MKPTPSDTGVRRRQIAFALFSALLLLMSVDRLIDAWNANTTWRVVLNALIAIAALSSAILLGVGLFGASPPIPTVTGPWVAEAKQILASGDKIGAIKVVRNATSLGLAEAKALVGSWERGVDGGPDTVGLTRR